MFKPNRVPFQLCSRKKVTVEREFFSQYLHKARAMFLLVFCGSIDETLKISMLSHVLLQAS